VVFEPGVIGFVAALLEAEALHRGDRPEEAAAEVFDEVERAMARAARCDVIDLWRDRGALVRARQRGSEALAEFRRVEEAASMVGTRYARGLVGLTHGHLLHKTESRKAVTGAVRTADERLEHLRGASVRRRGAALRDACPALGRPR
jgi:hypothetical protein